MMNSGRRVGGDGKKFAGGYGGMEVIEKGKEVGIARGARLDVYMDACKTGMTGKQLLTGAGEVISPRRIVNACGACGDATNPW